VGIVLIEPLKKHQRAKDLISKSLKRSFDQMSRYFGIWSFFTQIHRARDVNPNVKQSYPQKNEKVVDNLNLKKVTHKN
jgi:hypothetical protein